MCYIYVLCVTFKGEEKRSTLSVSHTHTCIRGGCSSRLPHPSDSVLSPPPQCVVGGCTASFSSQGGLARHVPSHFSQQSAARLASQARLKEETPSKASLNRRKKLKNKRRRALRTYALTHAHTPQTPRPEGPKAPV